jgi:hypothetical protein
MVMAVQDWNTSTLAYEVPAYNPMDGCGAPVHMVNDSHGRIKDGSWEGAAAMCGKQGPAEDSGFSWVASFGFATCPACLRAYVAAGGKGWFLPLNRMSPEVEQSVDEQLRKMHGAHYTNVQIRKDGQDIEEGAD